MHVFLICDYDGPIVIDFGTTAASAETRQRSAPVVGARTSRAASRNIRRFLRWRHGLSLLAAGIAELVTVRPGTDLDIPRDQAGESRST
jgi:hypothetical protein